jgi:hypothetical protein
MIKPTPPIQHNNEIRVVKLETREIYVLWTILNAFILKLKAVHPYSYTVTDLSIAPFNADVLMNLEFSILQQLENSELKLTNDEWYTLMRIRYECEVGLVNQLNLANGCKAIALYKTLTEIRRKIYIS